MLLEYNEYKLASPNLIIDWPYMKINTFNNVLLQNGINWYKQVFACKMNSDNDNKHNDLYDDHHSYQEWNNKRSR